MNSFLDLNKYFIQANHKSMQSIVVGWLQGEPLQLTFELSCPSTQVQKCAMHCLRYFGFALPTLLNCIYFFVGSILLDFTM